MGAPGTPSSSHAQPSLPPPEEIIAAKTVKLNVRCRSRPNLTLAAAGTDAGALPLLGCRQIVHKAHRQGLPDQAEGQGQVGEALLRRRERPSLLLQNAQRTVATCPPAQPHTHTRLTLHSLLLSLFVLSFSPPPQLCGKQDAKPTGVLPLREYFLKEAKDEKKKSAGWDLLSVKEVIPPGNLPVRPRRVSALPAVRSQHTHTQHTHSLIFTHDTAGRTVHSFKAETDKEKKEWMAILKKLTSPLPTVKPPPSPHNHRSTW